MDTARILREIEKVQKAVGVTEFPVTVPENLHNDPKGSEQIKNLAELIVWQTKSIDALAGYWPIEVEYEDEKGKKEKVELKNMAHAIEELFMASVKIAQDADASVQCASRSLVMSIKSTIASLQAAENSAANAKFLGYAGQAKKRELKIPCTPAAVGTNGKLDNQEIGDFLRTSEQNYVGWENVDEETMLPIIKRTLEDGEIARKALMHPLGATAAKSFLPGDSIREARKNSKAQEKDWEKFIAQMKTLGIDAKSVTPPKSPPSNPPKK